MRARLLVASLLFVAAAPLSAQQVSVVPFLGELVPLKTTLMDTTGGSGTYFKFSAHRIYGLRVSKQMSPSVTLQLQGGAGAGDLELLSGGTPLTLQSSLWFADARVRFRLLGSDATNLGVIGGAGWTQFKMGLFDTAHIQDSDNELKGTFTGIIGLGVKAHLFGDASFAADLTDRIHEQPVAISGGLPNAIEPTQHDLTMTFGLSFPLTQ